METPLGLPITLSRRRLDGGNGIHGNDLSLSASREEKPFRVRLAKAVIRRTKETINREPSSHATPSS